MLLYTVSELSEYTRHGVLLLYTEADDDLTSAPRFYITSTPFSGTSDRTPDHVTSTSNNEVHKSRWMDDEYTEVTTEQQSQFAAGATTAATGSSLNQYSSVEAEPYSTESPGHDMDTVTSTVEPEDIATDQTIHHPTTSESNNEVSRSRSTNEENAEVTTEHPSQVTTGMTSAITSSSVSPYGSVETEKHSTEQPDLAMDTTSSAEESEDVDTELTTVDHTIGMGQGDVTTTSTRQFTRVETEISTGQIHQQTTTVLNEKITTSMDQVYSVKSMEAVTSRSTYGAISGETTEIHSMTEFSLTKSDTKGPQTPDEVSPETRVKSTQIHELNLTETNVEPSTVKTVLMYNETAVNITGEHPLLSDNHPFVSGITTSDLQGETNITMSPPWDGMLSTSESYGISTALYRLEWDSWLPWSGCSLTCGGGTRYTFKICTPAPDNMTSYNMTSYNLTSECSQELGHGFCEFTTHFYCFFFFCFFF